MAANGLAPITIIDTDEGLIAFDTGDSKHDGEILLKAIRTVSQKPVKVIIYGHSHTAIGAGVLAEENKDVEVIGHPGLNAVVEKNLRGGGAPAYFPEIGPYLTARALTQFNTYMPKEGPDAAVVPLNLTTIETAFLPVDTPVQDGQEMTVLGVKMQFFTKYGSDDKVHTTVWLPSPARRPKGGAVTLVALIRHGPTAWNEQRRTQGHRDIPLSEEGRAEVSRWRFPKVLEGARVVASPLSRASETAFILFGRAPEIEPRLIEMNWSEWEGRTLADLRLELGSAFTANEARGLDFRPAGGESPREVRRRIAPWLAEVARVGDPVAAVTHLGVIRAMTSLALGWDMTGEPPCKFERCATHLFILGADGHPSAKELNVSLNAASP